MEATYVDFWSSFLKCCVVIDFKNVFNFSFKAVLLFFFYCQGNNSMAALQNLHVDSCLLIIINGPLLTINYEFSDSATFCVMSDNFNVVIYTGRNYRHWITFVLLSIFI